MSVYHARVQLHLNVEGVGDFEISQFGSDWAKDTIPKATVLLAVGRNAQDGETPAAVHKHASAFKKMAKAFVYFRAEGEYTEGLEWPPGTHLIFEGRVEGVTVAKVNGALHYLVQLVHWLSDLDFGSSLCQQNHVANPMEYNHAAVVSPLITRAGAVNRKSGIGQLAESDVIRSTDLQEDLWGKAIKPLLYGLAEQKGLLKRAALTDCGGIAGDNQLALAALTRIEGSDIRYGLGLSCFTPPLSLMGGADGNIPPEVARHIVDAILGDAVESFTNTTIWGKLIGAYASSFMFSVIPLVDRALVVPFIPGLRDTYCKSIKANEYASINCNGQLQRPLKAVGVFDNIQRTTGVMDPRVSPTLVNIGGCFIPVDGDPAGMLFLTRTPMWLQGMGESGYKATRSSGMALKIANASGVTPIPIKPDLKNNADNMNKVDLLTEMAEVYNAYAHSIYIYEALRGRFGEVSGKLRFDIAPGSTIKIEGTGEPFLKDDKLNEDLYASVIRVSIGINAETAKAGTSFTIAFNRNRQENRSDSTSVDKHPLFTTKFLGAPLVKALEFGSCCK